MSRSCVTCHEDKPMSEFGISNRYDDGVSKTCKSCVNGRGKRYYAANSKEVNHRVTLYRRLNADALKNVPDVEPDPSDLLSGDFEDQFVHMDDDEFPPESETY